ncbi:MAG: aminoglycoside phosphotransferase family protein [Pseudomonadales bacterium]
MSSMTPEQLTVALRDGGQLPKGTVTNVVQTQHPAEALMSEVFNLEFSYSADSDGNRPHRCLLKVVAPQMFRAGKGEVEFYRWLATQDRKPSALIESYGTLLDDSTSLAAVLMEDRGTALSPPEWPVPPQYAQCQQSVATLAQVHGRWWGGTELEAVAVTRPPPQQDVPRLAACTTELIDKLGDALSLQRRALLERVIAYFPEQHAARLADSKAATIVHGDAHLWNFLVAEDEAGSCALIDWQLWHVDFGVADLAYMLALHWFPERRQRYESDLIRHYVEQINASGQDYSVDQARSDYRFMVAGLLTKVVIYASVLPANIWWPHLERAFLAFDDLQCSQLIEG